MCYVVQMYHKISPFHLCSHTYLGPTKHHGQVFFSLMMHAYIMQRFNGHDIKIYQATGSGDRCVGFPDSLRQAPKVLKAARQCDGEGLGWRSLGTL